MTNHREPVVEETCILTSSISHVHACIFLSDPQNKLLTNAVKVIFIENKQGIAKFDYLTTLASNFQKSPYLKFKKSFV